MSAPLPRKLFGYAQTPEGALRDLADRMQHTCTLATHPSRSPQPTVSVRVMLVVDPMTGGQLWVAEATWAA